MDVFQKEIATETEEKIIVKDMEFRILKYTTVLNSNDGIRVPLIANNNLCTSFYEYCTELRSQGRLSKGEEQFGLIRFYTFYHEDAEKLESFGKRGFYFLNDYLVFEVQEDTLPPLERLSLWVEYAKQRFNVNEGPQEDVLDKLGGLDLSEEDEFE